MKLRPKPGDVCVIVGDTHGDHVNLLGVLRAAGALDEHGRKRPGYWLCHVGDVIHAGHGVQLDDQICLARALDLFDCLIVGNHEAPFLWGLGHFAGQNMTLDCQANLSRSAREGRWALAASAHGYLVTHAGLHPYLARYATSLAHVRDQGLIEDPDAVAEALNEALERRVLTRVEDPLLDAVSAYRGGRAPHGGVLWCDWRELTAAEQRCSSPVRQIVGHSPRRKVQRAFAGKYWNVDVGASLSGYVGAIVRAPGDTDWRAVTAGTGRPTRTPQS